MKKEIHNHHSCNCCEGHCHNERHELLGIIIGAAVFSTIYAFCHFFKISFLTEIIVLAIGYLFVGGEVISGAIKNILKGKIFDENFLMTISGIGAFATGSYTEAAAVMFLYRLGEFLQDKAVGRSERMVYSLLDIRPDTACVIKDGKEEYVNAENVKVGDLIIVRAGERIPLDGTVVEGSASVDLSALTGESVPVTYNVEDTALSGCVNLNGVLKVRVEKEFSESTASKIIDMVENASAKKAPQEKFITKFARYYTPLVVILAVLITVIPSLFGGMWQEWLRKSLVFLVISCPCALVISVPLAFFSGIGAASSKGILIKGGNYLDALTNVHTVVFDKTGTLTEGRFKVNKIESAKGVSQEELLRYAAYAETFSNHPIAVSIKDKYKKNIDTSELFEYCEYSGGGVKVKWKGKEIFAGNKKLMEEKGIVCENPDESETVVYIAVDKEYAGALFIADEIKHDAKTGIEKLKNNGIRKIIMLTGDNEKTAKRVSCALGINEFKSNLLPGQKLEYIENMKKEISKDKKIVFVGDGINDAPVLAGADIGISMGALGSDAAIEASDIVLMTDEVSKIAIAFEIARKTRKIVTENIIFSLGIKLLFLVLGVMGHTSMWQAVIGDVGVMLIAVLNSLRIK